MRNPPHPSGSPASPSPDFPVRRRALLGAGALALVLSLGAGACSSGTTTTTAASPGTTAAPASSTTAAGSPSSTSAAGKVSANTASEAQITAALTAAGVSNPGRWTREIMEYRPYPTDDPTLAKLKKELQKYNPSKDTQDKIFSVLTP